MRGKIPTLPQPRASTKKRMKRVKICAGERHRRNREAPRQKEPEWKRPGKILKSPVITEAEKDDIPDCNCCSQFCESTPVPAQPDQNTHRRNCDVPALFQQSERDWQ